MTDAQQLVLLTLAETFRESVVAAMVGGAMTCAEADAMAAAIELVDPVAAQDFLRGHANGGWEGSGDDEGDAHYHLRDNTEPAAGGPGSHDEGAGK